MGETFRYYGLGITQPKIPFLKWSTAVHTQILFFLSQQRFPIHPVPLLQELFLGPRRLAIILPQILPN
jgi:hypothetical protein